MLKIIGFFIFSFFFISVKANPGFIYYTPDTYPNSLRDYQICKLSKPGLICDPNGILANVTNLNNTVPDYIDSMLQYTQKSTNCSCQDQSRCFVTPNGVQGVTISVALLNSISIGNTPEEQTPEGKLHLIRNFAHALRYRQQRGSCDDDILIVITSDMIYTAVGDGSASIINQKIIDKVDEVVLPYLQTKDFNRAIVEMITAYSSTLRGEYYPAIDGGKPWYSPLPLWAVYAIGGGSLAIIIILIVIIILVVLHRRKTQGYSVGHVASRNGTNTRM